MGDISIKGRSPILRQGYALGGMATRAAKSFIERAGGSEKGKPHSTKEGRRAAGKRKISRFLQRHADKSKKIQPFAKGGKADKKWIQKATASIKRRGTKGKCTPITKKGCTGRAKALAKTFKKMAKKRKAA